MTKKFLVFFLSFLAILGCDKKEGPTGPSDVIPSNLFPFEVGRVWYFDSFETDTLDNPISGRTGKSIMRVQAKVMLDNVQCYVLVDTTFIPDRISVTNNFFHVDERGNLWQYFGPIGGTGPDFGKINSYFSFLSGGRWIKVLNREIGFNQVHQILDTTFQIGDLPVRFIMTSLMKPKISMTVPIGSYNEVYPGEMEFKIMVGLFVRVYKFNIWLVPNVGFIKFKEPITMDFGQPLTGYRIKELKSKNF